MLSLTPWGIALWVEMPAFEGHWPFKQRTFQPLTIKTIFLVNFDETLHWAPNQEHSSNYTGRAHVA